MVVGKEADFFDNARKPKLSKFIVIGRCFIDMCFEICVLKLPLFETPLQYDKIKQKFLLKINLTFSREFDTFFI